MTGNGSEFELNSRGREAHDLFEEILRNQISWYLIAIAFLSLKFFSFIYFTFNLKIFNFCLGVSFFFLIAFFHYHLSLL